MVASIQRHWRPDASTLRRFDFTLEELYKRTNIIHVSSSRGSNASRELSRLSTLRGVSRNTTATLPASAYINCALVGHNHRSLTVTPFNSPLYFIFLQQRRAQKPYHSRTYILSYFLIDDRTFQRVRGGNATSSQRQQAHRRVGFKGCFDTNYLHLFLAN